jgi:transcriptional regulator GlxA family with amidase domain
MLSHQAVTSKPLRELQVWMLENLREDLTVENLAARLEMSPRHFTRICLRETNMNPGSLLIDGELKQHSSSLTIRIWG